MSYRCTIAQRVVEVLVSDGLTIHLHFAGVGSLDSDEPGAALSEGCGHVVCEQISAAALGGFTEAEASDAFALGMSLAVSKIIIP